MQRARVMDYHPEHGSWKWDIHRKEIPQRRILLAHVPPEANAAFKREGIGDIVRDDRAAGTKGLVLHEGRARHDERRQPIFIRLGTRVHDGGAAAEGIKQ